MSTTQDLLTPGELVDGKYEVIQKLGTGGMGEVFLVRHAHLLDYRVIKVMRPNVATSETESKRFLAEARLATQIQNPNVSILYDFSQLPNGSFYMVWEYIPGKNLYEVIKICGAMPVSLVKEVAMQSLKGLAGLHKNGIIHRDISPDNIMLYFNKHDELRVKIIDLGIAKSFQADERLTQTGMFMGKLKYCSPEQVGLLPEGEDLDARTDIYSFGVVLYEMIKGSALFSATNPYGYIHKHTTEPPTPLELVDARSEVQEHLNQVTLRALGKDRNERYRTSEEFLTAVEGMEVPAWDTTYLNYFTTLGGSESLRSESTTPTGSPLMDLDSAPTHLVATPSKPQSMEPSGAVSSAQESAPTRAISSSQPYPAIEGVRRKSPYLLYASVLVILVVLSLLAYAKFGRGTAPLPAAVSGTLSISASPWAEIVEFVDSSTGEAVEVVDPITPLALSLPAGSYSVTLKSPEDSRRETRTFTISAGESSRLTIHFDHGYGEFLDAIR